MAGAKRPGRSARIAACQRPQQPPYTGLQRVADINHRCCNAVTVTRKPPKASLTADYAGDYTAFNSTLPGITLISAPSAWMTQPFAGGKW